MFSVLCERSCVYYCMETAAAALAPVNCSMGLLMCLRVPKFIAFISPKIVFPSYFWSSHFSAYSFIIPATCGLSLCGCLMFRPEVSLRNFLIHRFNEFAGCPRRATPRAVRLPFILLMLSSGIVTCDLVSQTLVSMETDALLTQVLDVVKHRCIQ